MLVFAVAEQHLRHRVIEANELDNEIATCLGQPFYYRRKRNIGRKHQVVDQRQADHKIRSAALIERLALAAAPALAGVVGTPEALRIAGTRGLE